MKDKCILWMVLVCLAAVMLACRAVDDIGQSEMVRGSGNVVSEERPVSGINKVALAMNGDLIIQVGDEERLVVEAEDNLLPYISTEVLNGRLLIRTQTGANLDSSQPIRYHLTVKALEGLEISSSGDITSEALQVERFEIDVSSSGDLDLDGLTAESLKANLSSSGNVSIAAGDVSELELGLSSSGNFDAEDLAAGSAGVTISSSGNVYYHGNPALNVKTSSSGEAIPLGE